MNESGQGTVKRWLVGSLLYLLVMILVFVLARQQGSTAGPLVTLVDEFSAWLANLLDRTGAALPAGLALAAGMVSAVNPCGFAMLPAYLGVFLAGDDPGDHPDQSTLTAQLRRAATVTVAMTAGFLLLFGLVGSILGLGAQWITGAFPWVGAVIGLLLAALGLATLLPGDGPLDRLTGSVPGVRWRGRGRLSSYFGFGVAYGLGSLGCTLPVFLPVVAVAGMGGWMQLMGSLVLYGLGFGLVVLALTLSVGLFRGLLVERLDRFSQLMSPVAGWLLAITGTFLFYYWLTAGGALGG